jgi:hypothetical protein
MRVTFTNGNSVKWAHHKQTDSCPVLRVSKIQLLKQQSKTVLWGELRPGTKEFLAKQEALTFNVHVSLLCFLQVLESFSDKTPSNTTQLEVVPNAL